MLLQHRLMHHRCVHHQHHCKRGVRCAAAPFDDRTKRALREAGEILSEAQELARQQTLSDLMSSWTADSTVSTSSAPPEQQQQQPPAPSTVEAAASQQQQQQAAADAAGDANINSSSNPAALEAFWCEQGLSQAEAQQLMREVDRDPQLAATCCNTQVLSQKLASLGRVLPGVDVIRLVARVPQLLMVNSSTAVQILVDLVNALPGCDVMTMVARQPRLLLVGAEGLPQRLQAVIDKLMALHPSHMERVVAGLIEENPELLLRMPYYLHDDIRLLDDLPIELQNMFVLGGKGLGYLHKYWNNRLTERDREAQWDATSTSSSMGSSSSNSPSAGGL